MACQAVLGIRAFSLSRRSRWIGWSLLLCYLCVSVLQWVTTLYGRQQVIDEPLAVSNHFFSLVSPINSHFQSRCRTVSTASGLGAWLYYFVAIFYDAVITIIALAYLLKYKSAAPSCSGISHLTAIMAYDGFGYLIVLTTSNIFNLILYITYQNLDDVQSAGVSVGYAVTWIMSQRLLTHLHEAYLEGKNHNVNEVFTMPKTPNTARAISHAIRRSLFRRKDSGFELTVPDSGIGPTGSVEVRIEQTVRLQHDSNARGQEKYSGIAESSLEES